MRWIGLAAVFCFVAVAVAQAADPKPNIIFIMADDLGTADLGYRGRGDQDAKHRSTRQRRRAA